jgi:predicted RNase H-like nuclease (RuvC/YqgF family)
MKGGNNMSNEMEEKQKEIDKLLWETSQEQTYKKYKNMKKDKKYNDKLKKIAQLTLKLEEENRKNNNN